ncbi:fatty-acid amide hydrolase 1-like [Empidonax traillii]|uniref:fatty-acid amide hydrolase 1-like n=1 Tax=Empidonax traillii TaxID=164674 RepID=UPI000FFDB32D|nr:fatty-acid amide hydrolase 1-like [Empidonax traillii]
MIPTCRSVKEMWNHHHQIQAYRSEFISRWKELHLDVVLCPVLGPAFTTGYPGKLLTAISSTMLYNILNFPAGVVPVSTVTEADEEELKLYQGCCDDPWDRKLKQVQKMVEQTDNGHSSNSFTQTAGLKPQPPHLWDELRA